MTLFSMLTIVDYIVIAVLVLSAILSTLRGMTREFLGLAGWFLAIFLAYISAPYLEPQIARFINIDVLSQILAWTIPFVASVVVWYILASIISPGLKRAGLGALDNWLGAFFGLIRGVLFVVAAYLGSAIVLQGDKNLPDQVTASVSAKISRDILTLATPLIPDGFQLMVGQVQNGDITLDDISPDAPELVKRGKQNVEAGTANTANALELLEDEQN